jgi:hypothetical protein
MCVGQCYQYIIYLFWIRFVPQVILLLILFWNVVQLSWRISCNHYLKDWYLCNSNSHDVWLFWIGILLLLVPIPLESIFLSNTYVVTEVSGVRGRVPCIWRAQNLIHLVQLLFYFHWFQALFKFLIRDFIFSKVKCWVKLNRNQTFLKMTDK